MQGVATSFASGDTYKVGKATEIRLSESTPHPGLRNGADNTFGLGDHYQIEDRMRKEKCLLISPVPSGNDSAGTESIHISYLARPELPEYDDDDIEIDDRYEDTFYLCLEFYVGRYSSKYSAGEIEGKKQIYEKELKKHVGDINEPPSDHPVNLFGNRQNGAKGASSDRTGSGLHYPI
jgi:hypothetical protein